MTAAIQIRRQQLGEWDDLAIGGAQVGGAVATAIGTSGGAAGTAAAAAWVPFVGPIVAGVTLAIGLIMNRKGPRQKVITTGMVDELEKLLKENLRGYAEGPRTQSSQAVALKNFDDAWAYLSGPQQCGNYELGNPGRACIADRQRGGQWDWFSYYRDPIANDTQVVADPPMTSQAAAELKAVLSSAGIPPSLLIAAALLIVGVILK